MSLHSFLMKLWLPLVCLLAFTACDLDDDAVWLFGDGMTDQEGTNYISVIIGDQEWCAENLRTTTYNDGSTIPIVTDNTAWEASTEGAFCWYNNDISNRSMLGGLYNWGAVASGTLCPVGWRVPSQSDWDELIVFLEGAGHAGQVADVLKNNIGWENEGNGRNLYGFNAMPGGLRESLGNFKDRGLSGYWWSSSPGGAAGALGYLMDGGNADIGQFSNFNIKAGFSVRCIKN
jgi:uncharacterized protein (TIGR02145 family)